MDPTCGLVERFRDLVLDQIWEQLLYLVRYGQNIEQLNERLEELTLERISIQQRIDVATNDVKPIEEKVCRWLSKVDEISQQVGQFREEASQAEIECSLTSCPNPWLRYKRSKRAKAMAQQVADICGKANFDRVSCHVPPPSIPELFNRESNEGINSRVLIMNQIMEALRNPSLNMVGLCGPAGVGKTTIAREVEVKGNNQKMFEKVIWATVSDELNIWKIQRQIAEKLGMSLNEETEDVRACRLWKRLDKVKNMLLILDDLWEELDLIKVGIPFADIENFSKNNEGCKVLLTSRNEELLSSRMKCKKTISVGVLSNDEALELFKRINTKVSFGSSSPELTSIATEIVQKCGGLPLAIATAAKALQAKDIDGWKDYIARWKNHLRRNITGIKEVDASLKLSYDPLSRENKDIFLLSAMLSHDPSIGDLLMYSVGLDYLQGIESMEEAHAGISDIVRKLKSLNLFLDSFSSQRFTIHDVFRDAALSIASDELHTFVSRHGTLKEWPYEDKLKACEGICFEESNISIELPKKLDAPRLQFFLLNSTKRDLTIPNTFFESSKELKLLAFTNFHFSFLPSLSFLQKLKALCLHSCVLEDIAGVRSLKKLKVLSLAHSEIGRLPIELAELTSLQMLNLSHCSKLRVIPEKLLSNFKKLEVLHMENSFDKWRVEGSSEGNENVSLDELKDLPISSLDIHIPNISMLPENLFLYMNLKRYRILIGKRWQWWECNHEKSKILRLELERGIHLKCRVRKLLEGVEDLYLYGSTGLDNILYSHEAHAADPCLKGGATYNVSNKMFRSLFTKVLLPKLEILELCNLSIEQLSHNSLSNLKKLIVRQCGFVKLMPFHLLKYLMNLEELEIRDCGMLKLVFDFEDLNDCKEIESSTVVVPLKTLKLDSLPKLKNVWSNHKQGNVSFPSLRRVDVSNCESLTSIFPASSISKGMLHNLEDLRIYKCGIDVIVANDQASESATATFKFPKMTSLILRGLVKLRSFYPERHTLEWPNLQILFIEYCDIFKIFAKEASLQEEESTLNSNHLLLSWDQMLLPKLEELELHNLNNLIPLTWDDQLSHNSLNNLKTLIVRKCSFVKLLPLHVLRYLNNLEELEIIDCAMLKVVFDFEDLNDCKEIESSTMVVPLKTLTIRSLPKLKNVWSNHNQRNVSFPSLRSVDVSSCKRLTSIFSTSSIAKGMLRNLEELRIFNCGIDVIVANDQASEYATVAFKFPRLTSLQLDWLPRLRNFYPERHTLEWPNLQRLCIMGCEGLEIFEKEVSGTLEIQEEESTLNASYPLLSRHQVIHNLEELKLHGQHAKMIGSYLFQSYHFPNVKMLSLSHDGIASQATISYKSLWKSFPNLEQLGLDCNVVVALETDDVVAFFSTLTLINIFDMDSLSPSLVSLQNLTHLQVRYCAMLTALMTSSTTQCLVHITHLSISYCPKMEEIITKQEGENDEDKEIIFSKLKVLKFERMPRLKRFCGYNYTFRFPLLEQIMLIRCPRFKIFSPGNIDTPSLKNIQLPNDFRGKHNKIWSSDLNKTLCQQRFMTSREMVLDKEDASMIRNDQFPVESCSQADILRIEGFVDDVWQTFQYTLLERFSKLKQIHVEDCSFEVMFPSHAPSLASFHNLTELKVSKCHQLVYLVTTSTAKCLVNLETLEISDCEKMEEIVKKETNKDVEREEIIFNWLKLELNRLPRLKTENFNIEDRAIGVGCRNTSKSLFGHDKVLFPKLEILELSNLLNNSISLIWEEQLLHNSFSNLKILIVERCDSLKSLHLHVLKSLHKLEKLEVRFCHMLEMVFGFKDSNYYKEMKSSSVVVPLNLTHLEVMACHGLTTLMTSSAARSLAHLTHLSIRYCDEIKEIITKQEGEDEEDREIIFNKLEILELDGLPRLKRFCSHNYNFSFSSLECTTIRACPRLTMFCLGVVYAPLLESIEVDNVLFQFRTDIWMIDLNDTIQHRFTNKKVISTTTSFTLNVENITVIKDVFPKVESLYVEGFMDEGVTFPYSSLERFPKLDSLHVEHCSFEEIFPSHDDVTDSMEEIPPFKALHIAHLDNLKSIWKDDSQLPPIHQNLTNLKVESCCNFLKLAPSSAYFLYLGWIKVYRCHQLIHLVTSSTAKSLVSLKWLEINDCKNMEEIVMNETNEDVESEITFNELWKIKLADMPSLKMFSSQSHTFQFPKLKDFEITGCPEMKMFCPRALKTPKLSKVKIEEHELECKDEGDLNKMIQKISSAKESIVTV